jgi:hypothetical protein
MADFQFCLQSGKQRKVGWVGNDSHVVFGKKRVPGEKGSVSCKMYVNTETTLAYIDKRLTKDRPDLSSERAPQIRQDCNFQQQQKNISGQKSQTGLDTKTY